MVSKPWYSNILPQIAPVAGSSAMLTGQNPTALGPQIQGFLNNYLKPIAGKRPTPQDEAAGINVSEGATTGMLGAPEIGMASDIAGPAVSATVKDLSHGALKAMKSDPEAGFIKIPNEKQLTTGQHVVQDKKGNFVPNPQPQGSQYKMDTSAADAETANAGNPVPNPQQPSVEPGTALKGKQFWAQEPDLTPQESKVLQKTGVDKLPVDSPTQEAFYKKVYARDLNGTTPEEKFQDIDAASRRLIDESKALVQGAPAMNFQSEFLPNVDKAVNEAASTGYISPEETRTMTDMVKRKLQIAMGGTLPNEITPSDLLDVHPTLSGMKQAAYKNGQMVSWSDPNAMMDVKASKLADDAVQNALYSKYPQVGLNMSKYGAINGDVGGNPGLRDIMSNMKMRNAQGLPNTLMEDFKKNPLTGIAKLGIGIAGLGALGKEASGALPMIESAGGALAGSAKSLGTSLANSLGYVPKGMADNKNQNEPITHMASSIPQDVNGHYTLPQDPNVTPLTPGTPEYTRANAALPGNSRQFMVNAPQNFNSVNTVQDDVKNGMPLDLMTHFKSSQDVQAYLSNPSSPYAKQLADIGSLNAKFRAAYAQINGSTPDDSQILSPGDSKEQFQEKYNAMVSFLYDNYSQFQIPYLQTTEAPSSSANTGGGTVPYKSLPPVTNTTGMLQQNFPQLPPIQ